MLLAQKGILGEFLGLYSCRDPTSRDVITLQMQGEPRHPSLKNRIAFSRFSCESPCREYISNTANYGRSKGVNDFDKVILYNGRL